MLNKTTSNFWLTAQTNARLKQQFPSIQTAPRQNRLLLSFQQERLWYLEHLDPNTSVYNLLHIIRFSGPLNLVALKQSLQEITRRHEILRTYFLRFKGVPFQCIGTNILVKLPIIDLRNLPLQQREIEVKRLALEEAEQPFDLTKQGLWRLKLLRLAEDDYRLIRTIHHIVFDGWSHNVFMRELGVMYGAFSCGKPSPLPNLPFQYVDFAYTQKEWFKQSEFATQLDYWKQQLSGRVSSLELPTHNSKLLITSYQGDCQSLIFSKELTKAIKTLSYQQGVSLFATLLTAFKVLLYSYTKQEDIIICSPVAGRHRHDIKNLIGYFNNVVVIRTDLSNNPNFDQLLTQVSQVVLDAYVNQDFPLQKLIELPHLAHTTLTRAMFALQNIPNQTLDLKDIEINSEYIERPISNFDLSLSMEEKEEQLSGVLQYKIAYFENNSIRKFIEDFQILIESIVANPEQSLSSLSSLISRKKLSSKQGKSLDCGHLLPLQHSDEVNACPYVPPRDSLEFKVSQIWQKVLGSSHPIGIHDNLFLLGASSLSIALIAEKIQETFQTELPLTTLFQTPTIEQVSKLLRESVSSLPTSPLVPIQPKGNNPPLFLCEGVGIYCNLVPYLGSDQPIYALIRDKSAASESFTCIEDIATYYLRQVKKIQPEGPYFLGGLCFGGLVAFEMAHQLYSEGKNVGMLLLLDTPAGANAYKLKPAPLRMLGHLSNILQFGLPYLQKKIEGGKIKYLRPRYQPFKTSQYTSSNIANTNQSFRESTSRIAEIYQYRTYPGRVTLFTLKNRSGMTDSLFDPALGYIDPLLGWGSIVTGGIDVHHLEGEHTSILREPYIKLLAERLKICLEKAQSSVLSNKYSGSLVSEIKKHLVT